MTDKTLEEQVYLVLNAELPFTSLLGTDAQGTPAFYVGQASPLGVRYPSVNFDWKEYDSEEVLPAGHGTLCFIICQEKSSLEKYSKFVAIREALLEKLNRNRLEPLTSVDMLANTGIRVVRIVRSTSDFGYKELVDKHYSSVMFSIVKSEREDLSLDFESWNTVCPSPSPSPSPSGP